MLLKWMGAAAAVPAVAAAGVLATTRTAHAAIGDPITAGNTTQASATTTLQAIGGSGTSPLFFVDNSSATNASGLWGFGSSGFSSVYGQGSGSGSRGVYGVSDSGYGVLAASTTGIDVYASGTGRLQQFLQTAAGAPTVGSFAMGEQIRDSLGDLYICTASDSPGTWKKVAAIAAGAAGGAVTFLGVPIRLLDTRLGASDANTTPGAPIAGGATLQLPVGGVTYSGQSIPSEASGVFGNITVVNPSTNGRLIFYPSGHSVPSTSSINWGSTLTTGNFTLVGTAPAGTWPSTIPPAPPSTSSSASSPSSASPLVNEPLGPRAPASGPCQPGSWSVGPERMPEHVSTSRVLTACALRPARPARSSCVKPAVSR